MSGGGVKAAFPFYFPTSIRAELLRDAERAIPCVSDTSHGEVRELWKGTSGGLRERATELAGMRRRELLGSNSHSRHFASKVHLNRGEMVGRIHAS